MKYYLLYPLIYLFVFVTGAAGLVYQVTWQKYLQRLLGSDNIATAIILGVFLGGLSLGYYLCGILTTRLRNHFRAYAVLELIIGAWCLLFPIFFDQLNSLTASWEFKYPYGTVMQGLFCSFVLMGIPTICMGGTIPFLTRALTERLAGATAVNSRVYAINTAGAFVGTLLAGFYLIPEFGLPLTMMKAALINIAAFLFFYVLAKYWPNFNIGEPPGWQEDTALPWPGIPDFFLVTLYATAFLSGFYVMTLENVMIRLSALSFGSSSYSFSLIVAVFIFSIAVGSFMVSRLKVIRDNFLFLNQFAIALGLLVIYFGLDSLPYLAHLIRITFQSNMAGFWSYYLTVFVIILLFLFLPVALMGATLPLIFHNIRRDMDSLGKHAGYIFSCNTLGSLLGSLAGGILLFAFFDIPIVYLLAVILSALSALLLARPLGRKYLLPAGALFTLLVIMLALTPSYDKNHFKLGTFRTTIPLDYSFAGPKVFFDKFSSGKMIFYRDGVTATVSVLEDQHEDRAGRRGKAIIVNGKSDSHTLGDAQTLKLLAHLPLLLSERIDDVLVIGLGTGVTAAEATLYPQVKRLDVAEISAEVIAAQKHFRDFNRNLLEDARVHMQLGDALRILTRGDRKWDVIISEPSNPWTAGVDQLFTREFYRQARKKLKDNGIFLQWLHLYSADMRMVGMVLNTLRQEFPQIRVFFGNSKDLLIVATTAALAENNIRNAERLLAENPALRDSLREINIQNLDSLLLREIMVSGDIQNRFQGYGQQTMDYPYLHYLAGKLFFLGSMVSFESLLSADTAAWRDDYLLHKKYRADEAALSHDAIGKLIRETDGDFPPALIQALKLRAWMRDNQTPLLTPREREHLRVDLLSLIMAPRAAREGAEQPEAPAGYRERLSTLLTHVEQTRTWLSPYPLHGLTALLAECARRGRDPYEKNWCRLQQASLLIRERKGQEQAGALLSGLGRDEQGRLLLHKGDEPLLERLQKILTKK